MPVNTHAERDIHGYDLSVIVPMHNAIDKADRCLASLQRLDASMQVAGRSLEVIIIDDCSSDGTPEKIKRYARNHWNWKFQSTDENSGSPSLPRNIGIASARGKYLFFLDGDDEIEPLGVHAALELADEYNHELVRGPVEVHYLADSRMVVVDTLSPSPDCSTEELLMMIAKGQSLNCSALWRRDLITKNDLAFDIYTRMGEDIVFTAAAMTRASSIGYVGTPLFRYVRHPGGGSSSMHHFGGRELRELVSSWQSVEDHFEARGLSYLKLHGDRTVNYALRLVIRYHMPDKISHDDLEYFAEFFERNRNKLRAISYVDSHVTELVDTLCLRGARGFWESVKPRLLIAGHDLKFITPVVPKLRRWFSVRVDEWPTEVMHSDADSQALLNWADFVWVEWLTAASVWYAARIRPTQKLVVRAHRYELGRSYGDVIASNNVAAFIAIAPHCLEDMIERFHFDRSKVRFIPNFYQVDDYQLANRESIDRLFRLAMIGAVPQRKGLLQGLELLRQLRTADPRYTMSILGKLPEEMPWIGTDPHEQEYFAACTGFIQENAMEESVKWVGWANTRETIKDYGFVLSMSEHEGSHVGPGEAYCAGNQGIFLRWRGAEFVYPESLVFTSIEQMAEHVLNMQNLEDFNRIADKSREFMLESYDVNLFVSRIRKLFREVG